MKTEQEQLCEMIRMLEKLETGDYCSDNCYGCCGDGQIEITCPNIVSNFIQALHEAGYGNVSECKAEIEKSKEETSNIRKDTAKEFATRICEMLWNLGIDRSGNRFSYGDLTSKEVLYVAKQFGVDIDDCLCKENTIATSHINKLVEQDKEIKKLEQQVKQAKVDALNELKTHSYYDDDYMEGYVFVSDIDELIEEIGK